MSTESIESIASQPPAAAASCAACAAPLADDQRYCLQCGERTTPGGGATLGPQPVGVGASAAGHSSGTGSAPPSAPGPPGATPPSPPGVGEPAGRGNAVTVLAGVGVLLLAMGIGVLIGRSGSEPSPAPTPAQVISVASTPAAGTTPASPEAFTGDWPAGASGYTVQLQTLALASTPLSAVQAAKGAAEAKGAKAVGALKSDEFASLTAGSYIVYAGRYASKAQASKALGPLKKNFPAAKVLHVGAGAGKGAGAASRAAGNSGVGSSPSKPAPPAVLESLKSKGGKSYEEQSKNLPNVVSTG